MIIPATSITWPMTSFCYDRCRAIRWPISATDATTSLLRFGFAHLNGVFVAGATDVRSAVYIIGSQKEKCEELRHQCSVLQQVRPLSNPIRIAIGNPNWRANPNPAYSSSQCTTPAPIKTKAVYRFGWMLTNKTKLDCKEKWATKNWPLIGLWLTMTSFSTNVTKVLVMLSAANRKKHVLLF